MDERIARLASLVGQIKQRHTDLRSSPQHIETGGVTRKPVSQLDDSSPSAAALVKQPSKKSVSIRETVTPEPIDKHSASVLQTDSARNQAQRIIMLEQELNTMTKKWAKQRAWIDQASEMLSAAEQSVAQAAAVARERDQLRLDLASIKDARVEVEKLRGRCAAAEEKLIQAESFNAASMDDLSLRSYSLAITRLLLQSATHASAVSLDGPSLAENFFRSVWHPRLCARPDLSVEALNVIVSLRTVCPVDLLVPFLRSTQKSSASASFRALAAAAIEKLEVRSLQSNEGSDSGSTDSQTSPLLVSSPTAAAHATAAPLADAAVTLAVSPEHQPQQPQQQRTPGAAKASSTATASPPAQTQSPSQPPPRPPLPAKPSAAAAATTAATAAATAATASPTRPTVEQKGSMGSKKHVQPSTPQGERGSPARDERAVTGKKLVTGAGQKGAQPVAGSKSRQQEIEQQKSADAADGATLTVAVAASTAQLAYVNVAAGGSVEATDVVPAQRMTDTPTMEKADASAAAAAVANDEQQHGSVVDCADTALSSATAAQPVAATAAAPTVVTSGTTGSPSDRDVPAAVAGSDLTATVQHDSVSSATVHSEGQAVTVAASTPIETQSPDTPTVSTSAPDATPTPTPAAAATPTPAAATPAAATTATAATATTATAATAAATPTAVAGASPVTATAGGTPERKSERKPIDDEASRRMLLEGIDPTSILCDVSSCGSGHAFKMYFVGQPPRTLFVRVSADLSVIDCLEGDAVVESVPVASITRVVFTLLSPALQEAKRSADPPKSDLCFAAISTVTTLSFECASTRECYAWKRAFQWLCQGKQ